MDLHFVVMTPRIAPSILSADFSRLAEQVKVVEEAGAGQVHIDVMDGHFVPNLTFGPMIIKSIRKMTECHLETHLMIEKPHESLEQYIEDGSDTIIFHLDASNNPEKDLMCIRDKNVSAGIAINPDTDENRLKPFLDVLDYILVMSVFPGKGGQTFIPETLNKMKNIVSMRENRKIIIGVDGGINMNTISKVFATKIDVAIVGSGLFKAQDIIQRYQKLLNA